MSASIWLGRAHPTRRPACPHKYEGYWYLIRRVPLAFRGVDKRVLVRLSTGIRIVDDPHCRAAEIAVENLDQALASYWHDLRSGRDVDAVVRYRKAQIRAQELGFSYLPLSEVTVLPVQELAKRLALLVSSRLIDRRADVYALLGGEDAPKSCTNQIPISEMTNEVEAIVSTSLKSKSLSQKGRWRSTRTRAASSLIEAIGCDKPINNLTRIDALAFRQHWRDRVLSGRVQIGSVNKYIGAVVAMYRAISDHYQLDLPSVFDRISLRGGEPGQRTAFDASFIQDHLLADGAFDGVKFEARRLLYLMIETGLRPSEACNLSKSTIILTHDVPHILVRPDGRELKSKSALRDIPLVGVALMAMIAQPDSFPRNRDKSNSLSALLNKVLINRHLRPSGGGLTLYSIRHAFSDRLRNAKAPDSTVDYFMGHAGHGPKYGKGLSLQTKLAWLSRIAFRPPEKV